MAKSSVGPGLTAPGQLLMEHHALSAVSETCGTHAFRGALRRADAYRPGRHDATARSKWRCSTDKIDSMEAARLFQ